MAVDSIRPHIERDSQIRPGLEQPELIDQLRHGNIYEILRTPGVNRRDLEEYLANQSRVFQNQIIQDYQIYSEAGSIPPPAMEAHFPVHAAGMTMTGEDRQFFKQEMGRIKAMKATTPGGQGGGQDVAGIADKSLKEWDNFFSELQMKVIDQQAMRELKSKTAELNREVQRIISMVLSGQVDPEYVLIAAAKSNMLQNGTFFSWKGKRIMHLNQEMEKATKELVKMDPADRGFFAEQQMSMQKTREGSTQMQLEMMDIQKFAQNIATTLDWVNNAIRMFAQMRQTPTQAVAAR
ncbi:MAG: hypothetical protein Q8P84_09330 [Deltaproteobacteria bacterium]|nr:hypothetical protein [Deltaproteobacteria bacterium]